MLTDIVIFTGGAAVVAGIALIHVPSAVIVAGVLLLAYGALRVVNESRR